MTSTLPADATPADARADTRAPGAVLDPTVVPRPRVPRPVVRLLPDFDPSAPPAPHPTAPHPTAPHPTAPHPTAPPLATAPHLAAARPGAVGGPDGREPAGPGGHPPAGPRGSGAGDGPRTEPVEPQARATLTRILEVLDGRRPAAQLSEAVTAPVLRYLVATAHRPDLTRHPGRGAPVPPARVRLQPGDPARGRVPPSRAGTRAMRVCRPADGVAEVCLVWRHRGRFRAVAARFELTEPHPGRWRCTALRLG